MKKSNKFFILFFGMFLFNMLNCPVAFAQKIGEMGEPPFWDSFIKEKSNIDPNFEWKTNVGQKFNGRKSEHAITMSPGQNQNKATWKTYLQPRDPYKIDICERLCLYFCTNCEESYGNYLMMKE